MRWKDQNFLLNVKMGKLKKFLTLKYFLRFFIVAAIAAFGVACKKGSGSVEQFLDGIDEGTDGNNEDVANSVVLTPNSHDFGALLITAGTPLTQTIIVSNPSKKVMAVGPVTGSDSSDFVISGDTCSLPGTSIATGESCSFVVNFKPLTSGAKTFAVTVKFGPSGEEGTLTVNGNYTGKGAAPAELILSEAPGFDYGPVVVGAVHSKTLSVNNIGNIAATSAVGGGLSAPFSYSGGVFPGTGGTCSSAIEGDSTCTIVVDFSPTTTGIQSDLVELTYEDGNTTQVATRAVQGTGATPAVLSLSDGPTHDFGTLGQIT